MCAIIRNRSSPGSRMHRTISFDLLELPTDRLDRKNFYKFEDEPDCTDYKFIKTHRKNKASLGTECATFLSIFFYFHANNIRFQCAP